MNPRNKPNKRTAAKRPGRKAAATAKTSATAVAASPADLDRFRQLSDRPWHTLSAAEQQEQCALLDRIGEVPASLLSEPTPEDRARLEGKLRRGRGRPRIGAGCASVLISVERGLLRRADAYAKAHGLGRSELFARSVEQALDSLTRS